MRTPYVDNGLDDGDDSVNHCHEAAGDGVHHRVELDAPLAISSVRECLFVCWLTHDATAPMVTVELLCCGVRCSTYRYRTRFLSTNRPFQVRRDCWEVVDEGKEAQNRGIYAATGRFKVDATKRSAKETRPLPHTHVSRRSITNVAEPGSREALTSNKPSGEIARRQEISTVDRHVVYAPVKI